MYTRVVVGFFFVFFYFGFCRIGAPAFVPFISSYVNTTLKLTFIQQTKIRTCLSKSVYNGVHFVIELYLILLPIFKIQGYSN